MRLITVAAVLGALLSFAAWGGQADKDRWPDKLKEGDAAPDFTLKSPDEKTTFKLSTFAGKKPVLLVLASYT